MRPPDRHTLVVPQHLQNLVLVERQAAVFAPVDTVPGETHRVMEILLHTLVQCSGTSLQVFQILEALQLQFLKSLSHSTSPWSFNVLPVLTENNPGYCRPADSDVCGDVLLNLTSRNALADRSDQFCGEYRCVDALAARTTLRVLS